MDSTFKSTEDIEKDADIMHRNQNKRKNKKNLREKRRSTGVILMPHVDGEVTLIILFLIFYRVMNMIELLMIMQFIMK